MRFRSGRGLDPASAGLIGGGALLLAAAIVAGVMFFTPAHTDTPVAPDPTPTVSQETGRASVTLPTGKVAMVLVVDPSIGAGGAARPGDAVDVLGYFSHAITGGQSETRVLAQGIPVLGTSRSGASVALTLAVSNVSAVLLQEALAIGARPLITLRAVRSSADRASAPTGFSDADLAERLAGSD